MKCVAKKSFNSPGIQRQVLNCCSYELYHAVVRCWHALAVLRVKLERRMGFDTNIANIKYWIDNNK